MKTKLTASLLLAAAAIALSSPGAPVVAQGQQALVIQGGTLIDGNGGAPVANSVIVITGNRITAVGRAGQVQVPAGAQVINANGKWITPGLVDAKANWNWMYGEAFLKYGVTSAMVTGARNDQGIAERDAIDHGIFPGPRLYQGVINMQGGGPKGDRKDNYHPGDGSRVIGSVEAARAFAKSNMDGGADFLGSNDGDGPPEIFAAYAEEAHKAGKGVVMRCVGPQTRGKECVLAGADVMIHTGELGIQMNKNPDVWKDYVGLPPDPYCDLDPAKEKEMIAFLLQHNTALEPDFMATGRSFPSDWKRFQQESREVFNDPVLRAYYSEEAILDLYDNQQSAEEYLPADLISLRTCGFKNHAKFIGDFVNAGGHAVVASDITQTAPGLGVHHEMMVFQNDAKIAPMKVLQATTKWVADHFKIKDIGSIETGKFGDILILNADPTQTVENLRKINTVIKDGKVVDTSYKAWYKGYMFSNDRNSYDHDVVSDSDWAAALKDATRRGRPRTIATVTAPNGNKVDIAAGVFNARRGPGVGPLPAPSFSPTPGIEALMPHTVIQGAKDTTFTLTGFNFVKGSVVWVDEHPVPTKVESATKISFTLGANELTEAGKRHLVVKNPLPLDTPVWGQNSNKAHILVPYTFTTKFSQNKY